MRPRLLDLFACEGGCTRGYQLAGFEVTAVDLDARALRRNPADQTVLADALGYLASFGHEYDAVHASPPCQAYASVTAWRGDRSSHPDLYVATRAALVANGRPWVIENVPGSPVRADYELCGSNFGLPVRRHRVFEASWHPLQLIAPCDHQRTDLAFEHKDELAYAAALGCDWMTGRGGRQAIPPAYTRYIGRDLLAQVGVPA